MKKILMVLLITLVTIHAQDFTKETKKAHDARMQWWRDARFGMFIHWGLYSIPAGEWGDRKDYGEWIRTSAEIPIDQYDKFVGQFNPVKFDAEEWVKMAKYAGMKYIVITSKHHDGFCLFDSKFTDFDVMSTPFKRDILKELNAACKKHGLKMCWYHSIMDWHHPDYLPRRDWEKNRSTDGADFERYIKHLKAQLKELLTNYGEIGVLWFDGQWEDTWNDKYGIDLYNYVRSLQPNIIINNRVGANTSGLLGFREDGGFNSDFGTPEQQIPATGLPGVDWESCMTMNDHWGYNKNDKNFKSTKDIIQMLADIASKGGNYLLNVGPTSEGLFPQESIDRLKEIGDWMQINGESIYGTSASPFIKLDWGRCTVKKVGNDTRLYLHVFNWPSDGKIVLDGLLSKTKSVYLLSDKKKNQLAAEHVDNSLIISVPKEAPDKFNSVIVLNVIGKADIANPPEIISETDIFVDKLSIRLSSERSNVQIRYTLDGSEPISNSPIAKKEIRISNSATLTAKCFRDGKAVSASVKKDFKKVEPIQPIKISVKGNGVQFNYYEGSWSQLPDFGKLKPINSGTNSNFDLSKRNAPNLYGFDFYSYIKIPITGVYTFFTSSDDGSSLYIDDKIIVDNDGLHGSEEKSGAVPLTEGYHLINVKFFERDGGEDLKVLYKGPGISKQRIPDAMLFIKE